MAVALPSPPLHSISIRIISSQAEVKESRRIPTETKLANKDQGSRILDPGNGRRREGEETREIVSTGIPQSGSVL